MRLDREPADLNAARRSVEWIVEDAIAPAR